MTLKECYDEIGSSYDEAAARFGNEAVLKRFVIKFTKDPSFKELEKALADSNGEAAFRAAHTLKGLCLNFGFDALYKASAQLTEMLRDYKTDGTEDLFNDVKREYERLTDAINRVGDFTIRTAAADDIDAIAAVEAECFPPAEAAPREEFVKRLEHYADHFWLMFDGEKLISFVDGMVTDIPDLTDEMYEKADMHDENGVWQMIFGVNTIPEYRNRGFAGQLIKRAIDDARVQGRKGLVLTCKEQLIEYYALFGFVNEGISGSVHGDAVWYQMRLVF